MFKLSRYFSIASAIAIGLIMCLFAVVYRAHERAELIENEERHNVILARSLANALLPAHDAYIKLVRGVSGDALRARPETIEMDRQVRLAMELLPVRKVKIYDPYGLTVYSSELAQIGESKSDQPAFEKLVSTLKPDSKLNFRDTFTALSGVIAKVDLVETYVPILGENGQLHAVVELYTDVSAQIAHSNDVIVRVGLMLLAAFGALYIALYLIVHRANRVLARQYNELTAFNEKLESRVAERTTAAETSAETARMTSRRLGNEVEERKRIEAELIAQRERLLCQQLALGDLIHEAKPPACQWMTSVERLMCKTAEVLGSARASTWLYTPARDAIECIDLYDAVQGEHRRGASLPVAGFPRYFAALEAGKFIAAHDAYTDPSTSEFRDIYLAPNGITSMLDVPLVRDGKVSGVLCVEHIGPPIVWTPEQQVFASAIASLVALVLEERDRVRIEQELIAGREAMLNQQIVLGELLHDDSSRAADWQLSIERLMHRTATTLGTARASAWLYTPARDAVECIDLYVADKDRHYSGFEIAFADHPSYFEALETGKVIAADDARSDPRTANFLDRYLSIHGTTSMLSIPIVREGRVFGAVCIEHSGEPIVWRPEQQVFASAIASLVALAIERRQRLLVERELRTANAELKRATDAKSEFLATMSHEIRTPMNGVLGMLGLLLREKLETKQRNLALIARDSAEGLLAILNDILDFSKLNEGKVSLEVVDFSPEQILKDVFTLLRPKAAAKSLQLELQLTPCFPRMLSGDPTRLRQIFFNLIGNGIKFTQRGSVRVNASWRPGDNDLVIARFEISDTGVGIPAESVGRLFTRFSQADASTTRRFGGTGLGLAICKQLVELMRGTIGVTSDEGKGSTFWFEVPLAPARHATAADAGGLDVEPPHRKLHILAADDNHVNLLLLDMLLTPLGHTVDLVADGSAALGAISNNHYDLVLMDVQMPELDGTTVTSLIRGMDGDVQKIPIIALTANAMPGDREQYLAAGMTDYVSKPIRGRELLAAIARVTGGSDTASAAANTLSPPAVSLPNPPASRPMKEKRKGKDRRKPATNKQAALPLIDRAVIEEWSSGIDQAAVGRLLEHVPDQSAQCLNEIKAAIAAGDLHKAQRAAHRLKGMASNVGAVRLAEIARSIEHDTTAPEAAEPKLAALEQTMAETLQELKKIA